jgi:Zn-dependent protease with chaperone function
MIEFKGVYFDGIHSKAEPVTVIFDGAAFLIRGRDDFSGFNVPAHMCTINPPLGNTRRSVRLPDGGLIETEDMGAIASVERLFGGNRGMRAVHFLESQWPVVLVCVIALAFCVWGFTRYGVPLIAARIAEKVPPASMERMSKDALKILDMRFVEPTRLSPDKAAHVSAVFEKVRTDFGKGYDYQLQLRKGRMIGANAFALPSGIILVTDELVYLAANDRELAAVLAHEMAHVKGRHAVRQLLQSAGVVFIISAMAGDIASLSSTAASLPTLLIRAGYSRDFEREADREAGLYCIRKGWGTGPYRKMLKNLTRGRPEAPQIPFISTHPVTAERIKYLEELERNPGGTRK